MSPLHPLRAYRQRIGESLAALAERVGTSKATLSRIETGKQNASLTLIAKLKAEAKGQLSADDFLHEEAAE
jgi:transcriptional regulator with XRE-family HTH domain